MAGRPSVRMFEAMKLVLNRGFTPYAAAKRLQISVTTMYRSRLYIMWRDGRRDELDKEMNLMRPLERSRNMKKRIANIK